MKEKFREKPGIDLRNYKIIGACNPARAYKAVLKEDKVGVMLPCNFLVQDMKMVWWKYLPSILFIPLVPVETNTLFNWLKKQEKRSGLSWKEYNRSG